MSPTINEYWFSPDRMRGYRTIRAMTRDDVARRIGTSIAIIKNYETGLTTPDRFTIDRLAEILGVTRARLAVQYADGVADFADAVTEDFRPLDADGIQLAADLLRRLGHSAAFRRHTAPIGTP